LTRLNCPASVNADLDIDRQGGYAVGFFFVWIISAGCSATTAWLVRTAPKRDAQNR